MGKSAAKIRRNMARAAARGETYTPPEPSKKEEGDCDADKNKSGDGGGGDSGENDQVIKAKTAAAQKLEEALAALQSNPDNLNSKERRSLKRKAEAIAAEESGCENMEELMEWYKKHKAAMNKQKKKEKGKQQQSNNTASAALENLSEEEKAKLASAKKLHASLTSLENEADGTLNAKERRSAKRKAEAIASEETGMDAKELLEWYQTVAPPATNSDNAKDKNKIPYILFIGQLAYTTTTDMLYNHFASTLGPKVITKETCKIRLLKDSKTNKSRGMAFLEVDSPEVLYECLRMHLTHLDGRRINVERSAGGGAATKKARITTYRTSQSTYISQTMDAILSTYIQSGDISSEELDEGVIALCKRHSATVVEAALKEYVMEKKERKAKKEELGEKEEEELRNPSAFLTHMIGRIAEEGVGNSSKGKGGSRSGGSSGREGRGGGPGRGSGGAGRGPGGRSSSIGYRGGGAPSSSVLQKGGVDMSISSRDGGGSSGGGGKISQIFPSMQRGRGRGRGYM